MFLRSLPFAPHFPSLKLKNKNHFFSLFSLQSVSPSFFLHITLLSPFHSSSLLCLGSNHMCAFVMCSRQRTDITSCMNAHMQCDVYNLICLLIFNEGFGLLQIAILWMHSFTWWLWSCPSKVRWLVHSSDNDSGPRLNDYWMMWKKIKEILCKHSGKSFRSWFDSCCFYKRINRHSMLFSMTTVFVWVDRSAHSIHLLLVRSIDSMCFR